MQTDVCDGCLIILRWGDVRQWGNYRYCAVCYEAAAGGDTDVDGDPPGESESQSGTSSGLNEGNEGEGDSSDSG